MHYLGTCGRKEKPFRKLMENLRVNCSYMEYVMIYHNDCPSKRDTVPYLSKDQKQRIFRSEVIIFL